MDEGYNRDDIGGAIAILGKANDIIRRDYWMLPQSAPIISELPRQKNGITAYGGVTIRRMMEIDLMDVVDDRKCRSFTDPWSYSAFKSDLNNEMSLPIVAVQDDMVIGYSILYIVADEMQIGNFAVATQHQKMGIGKK